jgi:hypothetical protein
MKHSFTIPLMLAVIGLPLAAGERHGDVIPPGTDIQVRTDHGITVARWDRGRIYPGNVDRDVMTRDGHLAIPRGAYCELIVRRIGPHEMALDLESITVRGRRYVLDTTGPEFNMNHAQYDNGAGIVGNIVGAIAGATGGHVEYRGDRIRVPDGAVLTFQLQQRLHVAGWHDEGYREHGEHYHHEEDHGWYR